MGYLVPASCQVRKIGSPTQKAVLMALAAYAWDDGSKIWVSKATIAADLEMGHRTVQDAIKSLVEKGVLSVVGEREAARGFTIEYRINLDVVELLPLTRPSKKHVSDGCGRRTPSPEKVAQRGAGDCIKGCGSRTQLSKEYIIKNTHAHEVDLSTSATMVEQEPIVEKSKPIPQTESSEIADFWAKKIKAGKFIAPSSISIQIADHLILTGRIAPELLRQRGIAYSAAAPFASEASS